MSSKLDSLASWPELVTRAYSQMCRIAFTPPSFTRSNTQSMRALTCTPACPYAFMRLCLHTRARRGQQQVSQLSPYQASLTAHALIRSGAQGEGGYAPAEGVRLLMLMVCAC